MNNKRYQSITISINMILRFLLAFTIITILFFSMTDHKEDIWKILYLIPSPAISYLIGKRIKHFLTFTVMHILLMSAYILLIDDIFLKIIFGMYLIVLAIMTFVPVTKKNLYSGNTPIGLIAIIIVANLYFDSMGQEDLKKVFFTMSVCFVLLYFINLYLLNFNKYFLLNKEMANIPVHQIVNSNHILFISFGILCFAIMLICTLFSLKDILLSLVRLIAYVLISAYRFIIYIIEKILPDDLVTLQDFELPEDVSTSPVLKSLYDILYYAFLILVLVVIIAAIIRYITKLYNMFYSKRNNDLKDKLEYLSPFYKKEKLKRENNKSIRKVFHNIFGKTNNEKIRKNYYNAIVANTNSEQISREMTPTQLTRYAFDKEDKLPETDTASEKEKELTDLYEKARYGKKESSKMDLLKVKKLLK